MNGKITVRDLKKIGLVSTPELDFGDDGTRFKMFKYKNVPVSYTKVNGEYYISIRFDYVDDLSYDVYSKFSSYGQTDDFNGARSVDLGKLLNNLENANNDINSVVV